MRQTNPNLADAALTTTQQHITGCFCFPCNCLKRRWRRRGLHPRRAYPHRVRPKLLLALVFLLLLWFVFFSSPE